MKSNLNKGKNNMRYEQKAELQDSNKARIYEENKKQIKTEEQLELEDLKNKQELIDEILAICNANKDNDYCCTNQLKDSIENTFKMWGY